MSGAGSLVRQSASSELFGPGREVPQVRCSDPVPIFSRGADERFIVVGAVARIWPLLAFRDRSRFLLPSPRRYHR